MANYPQITVEEYKERLTKFLDETVKDLDTHMQNGDEKRSEIVRKWRELLHERQTYAPGLRHIIFHQFGNENIPGYVLAYDNRYIVKIIRPEFRFLFEMAADDEEKRKDIAIHYLMQKQHWFNEFQQIPMARPMYDIVQAGIAAPGTNDHVDYFRLRFGVLLAQFFDVNAFLNKNVNTVLPNTYQYNNSFIVCYGKGTETPGFNFQFDVYFSTLIRLLDPNVTDTTVVNTLCNQLTNEVSEVDPNRGPMKIDIHLVNRVRDIFALNPNLVNTTIDNHITKMRNMQNREAGLELAGCTVAMLRQIVPDIEITTMTRDEEMRFANFVTGGAPSNHPIPQPSTFINQPPIQPPQNRNNYEPPGHF